MTTSISPFQIPLAGAYRIDASRSTISFSARHVFGLGTVRGTFPLRDGNIQVATPVSGSSARATISVSGFHTGVAARDSTILGPAFLDVERHPVISFVSGGLVSDRELHGTLTVRGVSRTIQVRVDESQQDGSGLRLLASARIDRYEFGLTAMKGMTGRHVSLTLDIRAERENRV